MSDIVLQQVRRVSRSLSQKISPLSQAIPIPAISRLLANIGIL